MAPRSPLAIAAGVAGWVLLPSGALVPVVVIGGVAWIARAVLPEEALPKPQARPLPAPSLWADWEYSSTMARGEATLAVAGERALWRIGDDNYVVQQGITFRPVSALSARQLMHAGQSVAATRPLRRHW